jgi:hypothetical protein
VQGVGMAESGNLHNWLLAIQISAQAEQGAVPTCAWPLPCLLLSDGEETVAAVPCSQSALRALTTKFLGQSIQERGRRHDAVQVSAKQVVASYAWSSVCGSAGAMSCHAPGLGLAVTSTIRHAP